AFNHSSSPLLSITKAIDGIGELIFRLVFSEIDIKLAIISICDSSSFLFSSGTIIKPESSIIGLQSSLTVATINSFLCFFESNPGNVPKRTSPALNVSFSHFSKSFSKEINANLINCIKQLRYDSCFSATIHWQLKDKCIVPGLHFLQWEKVTFTLLSSRSVKSGRGMPRPYGIVNHDKKAYVSFSIYSLTIPIPPDRVRKDVIPQGVQLFLITDNPFVVVPLPHRHAGRAPRFVDPFCAGGFE